MNVRPATSDDAPGIGAVQTRTSWATYTDHIDPEVLARVIPEREEGWSEKLAAGLPTAVAEQDGEIVGFASWGPSTWAHDDGAGEG